MKKILVLILMLCLCACNNNTQEQQIESVDIKESVVKQESEKIITHIDVDKKETVYASADAYGNIEKTEVEVILKSTDGDYIEDVSNLKDIKNTYSDETFTQEEDKLVFENKGEDIHYKGISVEKLPIDLKITYYLNNQEVKVEDLVGKSGELKIRFDYKNNTNKNVDGINVVEPFIVMSMVMLDEEVFSNVEIKNGKLLEYGENKIALVYGLPGIKDSLRISSYELTKDIDLPYYGEIMADVRNFKLDYTATIISNGLFEDIKDEDLQDIYDMNKDMNSFKSSVTELKDNTSKLYDACVSLDEGIDQYTKGVSEIDTSMTSILEGSKTLNDSLKLLDESLKEYDKQEFETLTTTLKEQLNNLVTLLTTNNSTITSLSEDITAIKGKIELSAATDEQKQELLELIKQHNLKLTQLASIDIEQLSTTFKTLEEGINSLKDLFVLPETISKLSSGMNELDTYLNKLKEGTSSLAKANTQINNGLDQLIEAAKEFDDGMSDFVNKDINDITKLADSSLTSIADRIKIMRKLDSEYGCFSGISEGKKGKTTFLIETKEIK